MINAEDPHPLWEPGKKDLSDYQQEYLKILPKILDDVAKAERIKENITTFQFLHAVDRYIEVWCIIPKG